MKKVLFILSLLLLLASCCPAQEKASAWIGWSYDYETIEGTPIDTSDIIFKLYISLEGSLDSTFTQFAETADTSYYLLADYYLYDNIDKPIYGKAYRISTDTYSASSDTVWGHFPFLVPGRMYNMEVLDLNKQKQD